MLFFIESKCLVSIIIVQFHFRINYVCTSAPRVRNRVHVYTFFSWKISVAILFYQQCFILLWNFLLTDPSKVILFCCCPSILKSLRVLECSVHHYGLCNFNQVNCVVTSFIFFSFFFLMVWYDTSKRFRKKNEIFIALFVKKRQIKLLYVI